MAKEWVDEANNNNVVRMLWESNEQDIRINKRESWQKEVTTKSPEEDEAWEVLVDYQISLQLTGLLKLVPQFTEKVTHIMARNEPERYQLILPIQFRDRTSKVQQLR